MKYAITCGSHLTYGRPHEINGIREFANGSLNLSSR